MRVLVTGGGGFLGRRISEMLLARGDRVRVFGRRQQPEMVAAGAECVGGDIRQAEAVAAAARGCDAVIHTAAMAGVWGSRQLFFETNVTGTEHVIHACLQNAIGRLVFTSSGSVVFGRRAIEQGDESLPYPRHYLAAYPESKAEAEKKVLAANGLPIGGGRFLLTCSLRPHLIWGPGDPHLLPRIVARAKAGRFSQLGRGTNRLDLTYIDNAAAAHVQAVNALQPAAWVAGNAYFIGDAEPVAIWSWMRELLARLGLPPIRCRVPFAMAYATALKLELLHRVFPSLGEPSLTRFVVLQLTRSHWFSHARATQDFGYRPAVDNATGLARAVEWLQSLQVTGGAKRTI